MEYLLYRSVVLTFTWHKNHLGSLLKHTLHGTSPRVLDSVGRVGCPRIPISSKFPGNAGLGSVL